MFNRHGLTFVGDKLACHICGYAFVHLGIHVRAHGWTAREYRKDQLRVVRADPAAALTQGTPVPAPAPPAPATPSPGQVVTPRTGRPPKPQSAIDAAVLAAVQDGATHGKAIAALAKVHVAAARRALARLVNAGRVEQHGRGRHGQFVPTGGSLAPRAQKRSSTEPERDAKVLAFLEQQAGPVRPIELRAALGVSAVPVQQSIKRLVASGAIVAIGATGARRIGVPRVMGPAAVVREATVTVPPPVPPATNEPRSTDRRLVAEIARVLKSGASYDAREIRRNVLTAFPTIAVEEIVSTCDAMARDGQVFRHIVGESGRRYQLRVRK
jgi:DNA-binding Lrp family transcriptional regulator